MKCPHCGRMFKSRHGPPSPVRDKILSVMSESNGLATVEIADLSGVSIKRLSYYLPEYEKSGSVRRVIGWKKINGRDYVQWVKT